MFINPPFWYNNGYFPGLLQAMHPFHQGNLSAVHSEHGHVVYITQQLDSIYKIPSHSGFTLMAQLRVCHISYPFMENRKLIKVIRTKY